MDNKFSWFVFGDALMLDVKFFCVLLPDFSFGYNS